MILRNLLKNLSDQKREERQAELYRNLLRREAKIGGQLFGPLPQGARREFFCLDERTWVWHEEKVDAKGRRHTITTRYDVRPNGVLKAQNGGSYQQVSDEELRRLAGAAQLYEQRVNAELYNFA